MSKKDKKYLSEEEIQQVKRFSDDNDVLVVEGLASTGLRLKELRKKKIEP